MDRYVNTHRGYLRPILAGAGALCLLAIFFLPRPLLPELFGAALLLYVLSFLLGQLTVEDKGDKLLLRFGPLPLIRRTVSYERIVSAEPFAGGMFVDGAGPVWTPMHGWSWSVGGSSRVRLKLKSGSLIIGTDDAEGLLELLNSKIKKQDAPEA